MNNPQDPKTPNDPPAQKEKREREQKEIWEQQEREREREEREREKEGAWPVKAPPTEPEPTRDPGRNPKRT